MGPLGRYIEQLSLEEKQALIQELLDKRNRKNKKLYQDIVDEYDLLMTSEAVRKYGRGIEFAYDAGMRLNVSDQLHMDKNYVERQKLYDVQRQIKKEMREFSRTELICEHIGNSIKELPKIIIENIPRENNKTKNKKLVVGIGDFHYGADYTVNGLYGEIINQYNTSVFKQRMEMLLNNISEIAEKDKPEELIIMIAGDMLDGILRQSQLQRLEYGLIDSAMHLAETLTSWLVSLEKQIRIPIYLYAVRGNHGEIRPLGSKAGQFPEENMERIIMHYLYARFMGQKWINIVNDDAPITQVIDVCGYQFLLTHGQNMNIESMAKDCVNLYHKAIDVFMVGHLHKSQSFISGIMPESNIYVERIPSICGVDPYAQSKGYGAKAGATAMLIEKEYGIKCVYPIVFQ